jgi:hypothetical protein
VPPLPKSVVVVAVDEENVPGGIVEREREHGLKRENVIDLSPKGFQLI